MPTRRSVPCEGECHSYRYEIYDIEDDFPEGAGNYIFTMRQDDKWVALYIGQARNLSNRLPDRSDSGHACALSDGATHIAVNHNGLNLNGREAEEIDLIRGLDPPCNTQHRR